jgi:predicted membrane-bound spermidine synthase
MAWFFLFFLISGFCSVLYEIVWLRLAMAQFGVTSPLVSIVLSAFMAGLGVGSWASGGLLRRYSRVSPLRFYALIELLIGCSAIAVPCQLRWGRMLLERTSISSSSGYYLASGAWVALTLVPWCSCMGATFPAAMAAIRKKFGAAKPRSFSFLYLANVLGALVGATVPLLLIELSGFRDTLRFGAAFNLLLFVMALMLSRGSSAPEPAPVSSSSARLGGKTELVLLFLTGLTSLGAEVVWTRQFTPYLGTVVYAFAAVLGVYLASTSIGSRLYRHWSRGGRREPAWIWAVLGLALLLPVLSASPQFHPTSYYAYSLLRLMIGVAPFSALLGFVTPMLVDRWSGGDPDLAGRAYAVNVLGCILGPLLAGFVLLPLVSERWVLLIFALPWFVISVMPRWTGSSSSILVSYASIAVGLVMMFLVKDFGEQFPHREILRDNTATVVATGEGMEKRLLVNGVGITYLTPMTKVMAHLPLASLDHAPRSALVVCFGMGTTYRSLMSWNIPVTAVELVPSVPQLLGYFHPDGPELQRSPRSHIVIDDGRRYLERTSEQYDVITIDPPPPVEAAGTSLLYSKEFYATIKQRLAPGGILQQWLPRGDDVVQAAVARALQQSFPYVRVFHSFDNRGFHFLASSQPLPPHTGASLAVRLPDSANRDFVEWGPEVTAEGQFSIILGRELSLESMIARAPHAPALQDDRPENEYYVLRTRFPRLSALAATR